MLCPTSSSIFQKSPSPKYPAHILHSYEKTRINSLICSTHFTELHGDIMLQVLGSFCPCLFTATLQAIGKLLEDGHSSRHDGAGLGASNPVSASEKHFFQLLKYLSFFLNAACFQNMGPSACKDAVPLKHKITSNDYIPQALRCCGKTGYLDSKPTCSLVPHIPKYASDAQTHGYPIPNKLKNSRMRLGFTIAL